MPIISRITLGLVFLFALIGSLLAQSQGPSPSAPQAQSSSQSQAEGNQQKPAANQNTTEEPPVVTLRILGPKPNTGERPNQNSNRGRSLKIVQRRPCMGEFFTVIFLDAINTQASFRAFCWMAGAAPFWHLQPIRRPALVPTKA
jgi:hypothetical protein